MKGIIFSIVSYFFILVANGQEIVPTRISLLRPERALVNFLTIDTNQQTKPNRNYRLILSHNQWYAVGDGDGQVFSPVNNRWTRIDKTRLEGYHYGAFLFDCNGSLMKYGGYGFWRSHGMFVRFNKEIGDWQIQPSNRDLPFSGELAFFNKKNNSLYSFGNHIFNQSTSLEKVYLDSLFRIDLLLMKWESVGKLNHQLSNLYHLQHRTNTLPNNNGCFILPIQSDSTALFFNFEDLSYGVYTSENNPRLFHFFKELPSNQQLFSDDYGLKILHNDSIKTLDSLSWQDALVSPLFTAKIIDEKKSVSYLHYTSIVGAIVFVSLVFAYFLIFKKRNTSAKSQKIKLERAQLHHLDLSIVNSLIFEGAIYPLDSLDYNALKKFLNQDASTIELNEWLGLENKQPENQKKQRAEWIKRMNAFFNKIGFKEDAFYRERQENDKRMFVYKMNINLKQNDALENSKFEE